MSTDTKLLAAQARIKVLREALESIKNFSPAGDWPDEFAVLATPDDTAELDALVADALFWIQQGRCHGMNMTNQEIFDAAMKEEKK